MMVSKRLRLILIGLAGSAILLGAAACSGALDSGKSSNSNGARSEGSLSKSLDAAAPANGSVQSSLPSGSAGAPASSVPAGQTQSDPKLQGLFDRKIVQTTSVDVGVKEVGRAFTDISSAAESAGGFVAGSAFSNVDKKQVADLTIRVPADQYQAVLAKIRGMGEVSNEKTDANNVTEEYTDVQARLRTLQATEQRYLDLLAKAETINDILTVQDRLDGVRGQIEGLQGRVNLLDHLTDLATITVHLEPIGAATGGGGGGTHPIEAAQAAWQHSLDALRGLATVALVVAAFSWWLVPPAVVAVFSTRWWMNRRSRTPADGAA